MASQTIQSGSDVVLRSPGFRAVLARIQYAALCDVPVLFQGESGVGKTALASRLHRLSGRVEPFVPWCVSQSAPTLAHAAIFGAVKGAYTGLDH